MGRTGNSFETENARKRKSTKIDDDAKSINDEHDLEVI